MVMDILGIVIAFITVILMFSILVTALNHAINQFFNSKHEGLKEGMNSLVTELNKLLPESVDIDVNKFVEHTTKGLMLDKANYVDLDKVKQVAQHLAPEGSQIDMAKLETLFATAEDEMQVIYQKNNDKFSFGFAAIIAMVMQLNAFQLFSDISTDAEFRNSLLTYSETIAASDEQQQIENAVQKSYTAMNKFNFKPLPHSWSYFLNWQNYIGMLLSAILISFGAPFWFKTLKSVVGLKDSLGMKHENKSQ